MCQSVMTKTEHALTCTSLLPLLQNKNKCSDDSQTSTKLKQTVLVMSLKQTHVTQSILSLKFLIYVESMHCLNYSGQESRKQFAVYDFDIFVTLK